MWARVVQCEHFAAMGPLRPVNDDDFRRVEDEGQDHAQATDKDRDRDQDRTTEDLLDDDREMTTGARSPPRAPPQPRRRGVKEGIASCPGQPSHSDVHLGPAFANGSIVPITAPFKALELDFTNLPPPGVRETIIDVPVEISSGGAGAGAAAGGGGRGAGGDGGNDPKTNTTIPTTTTTTTATTTTTTAPTTTATATATATATTHEAGTMAAHAIVFWWDCDLGPGGRSGGGGEDLCRAGERITISTSPERNGVRDHWRQGVRPLPIPLELTPEALRAAAGKAVYHYHARARHIHSLST